MDIKKFKYYVCNEFGDVMYEFTNEIDAMEVAFKYEGYFVSRQPIEKNNEDKN